MTDCWNLEDLLNSDLYYEFIDTKMNSKSQTFDKYMYYSLNEQKKILIYKTISIFWIQ